MSVSRTDRRPVKAAMIYLAVTGFCLVFSLVYERFSHGVYSDFMVFLFAIPLICGFLPFAVIYGAVLRYPKRGALNLYNAGVATLTVGSCMQGVFEIYGTTSDFVPVYWLLGGALVVTGVALFALNK